MADREFTISAKFLADLSDARAKTDAWIREVQSKGINVPVSANFGGGNGQTLGGKSAGSLPPSFAPGAASQNPTFFSNQLAQQIVAGIAPAIQQLAAAVRASIPTSSPNWSMLMGGGAGGGLGASSPNWGYFFGGLQQQMQAMSPTSSPNWSYLLGRGRGGPPGGGGGGGNPWMRGLSRFANAGFLAHELVNLADASRDYNIAGYLTGPNDFAGQTRNTLQYRKRLSSSLPYVGGVYDLLTDPGGQQAAGIELALRSATEGDEYTGRLRDNARFLTSRDYQSREALAPNDYERRRLSINARYDPVLNDEALQRKNATLADLRKQRDTDLATVNAKYDNLSSGSYGRRHDGGIQSDRDRELAAIRDSYLGKQRDIEAKYGTSDGLQRAARDRDLATNERDRQASVFGLFASAGANDLAAQGYGRAASRQSLLDRQEEQRIKFGPFRFDNAVDYFGLRVGQTSELGRFDAEQNRNLAARNAGSSFSTRANFAAGSNDRFGASLYNTIGSATSNFIGADQADKARAFTEGVSRIFALMGETGRTLKLQSQAIEGDAGVSELRLARNPLGAQLRAIDNRRGLALAALPDNFIFNNLLGGNRLRAAINGDAAADAALARQNFGDTTGFIDLAQGTRREQLNALLRRDPTGAAVAGSVGSTLAESRQLQYSGRTPQALEALNLGSLELDVQRRHYLDSFRGTDLDLRHFDVTNPRDSEDPGKVLQEIADGQQKIVDAINTLASD